MLHQRRLGQRRQFAQGYLPAGGILPEDPAVVRRVRDGLPEQAVQPVALVGRQLLGSPAGAGDQLAAETRGTTRCAPHLVSGVVRTLLYGDHHTVVYGRVKSSTLRTGLDERGAPRTRRRWRGRGSCRRTRPQPRRYPRQFLLAFRRPGRALAGGPRAVGTDRH